MTASVSPQSLNAFQAAHFAQAQRGRKYAWHMR
jgi:hypothetical protein